MLQVLQAVIDQSAVSKSTVTARQVKSIVERLFPCARKRKRGVNIGGINETEEYQQLWNRYLKLCTAYKAVTGEVWTE
jgi:hypothetical protein